MARLTAVEDTPARRKARGAFFTPPDLAAHLVRWAIRSGADAVLEPSCGEAAFLVEAADRLDVLGLGAGDRGGLLHGVDVHAASLLTAAARLSGTRHAVRLDVGDFFDRPAEPRYDAVIGNPPFVRYQDFSGADRHRGREAALRGGVNLTRLASSWAAFAVHAVLFLRPGGRLGLVLPAELLSVNYAAEVRQFLMRRFGRIRLVLFTERVFPGVLAEVVLLLAEGDGGTGNCELQQVRDVAELAAGGGAVSSWEPGPGAPKWTPALLPGPARQAYAELVAGPAMGTLHTWGETTLGAVTGNNRFFAMSPRQAEAAGLRPGPDLVALCPPGSRHLRGLSLSRPAWTALGRAGACTWLFRPPGEPGNAARAHIAAGETTGVQDAYKCRVRTPWWRVPLGPPADLFLTCMNADTPRLSANRARVAHLNSVHGLHLHPSLPGAARRQAGALLPLAALNSLTLLGAETVGRAYGGGLLKLEPGEADALPVPGPDLLTRVGPALSALRRPVAARLAAGRLLPAVELVDDVLLAGALGLGPGELATLRDARALLAGRRATRGASRPPG